MDATFSADGKRIVTGGEDGIAQVWDAATGQPVSSPFSVTDGFVQESVISPDGSLIAIYRLKMLRDTLWYFVIIWDAVTGQQVGDLFRTSRPFTRLVWMPNSREIVGLAENGESQRWRLIETDFSAAKLETFSQVLTAHRIDAIGNVVTVNAAELQQTWERWHKEAIMGAMK